MLFMRALGFSSHVHDLEETLRNHTISTPSTMILHSECTEYAKTAFIGDLAQCTVSFGKKCSK